MASIINASSSGSGGIVQTADASGVLQLQSNGTTALTVNTDASTTFAGYANLPNTFGFKNRIINGAMMIDQRNAGASVTPTDGQYTLDRWQALQAVSSKYTLQQNAGSVTPPAGFSKYLGCTSSSAYSVGAAEYFAVGQIIEGFNTADLAWGTASAASVTLSFWVRSSLTGTFGGVVKNANNSRSYPFTYTVSSANTWEQKSITIAGDTSGTYATDNSGGIKFFFGLGVGSTYSGAAGSWSGGNYVSATGATSVVGTNGATFYITGVQLEKGSTATSFDYRPYGTELQLCQRYYWNLTPSLSALHGTVTGGAINTDCYTRYPVPMRATPSITYTSLSNYNVFLFNTASSKAPTSITLNYATAFKSVVSFAWSGALGTQGTATAIDISTENLQFSAEL